MVVAEFHPICGTDLVAGSKSLSVPGIIPRPGVEGDSSDAVKRACKPTQMPMNGLPLFMKDFRGSMYPALERVSMQWPKWPTPGKITRWE